MYAYHVVTERPMVPGQRIIFDGHHHSGVYRRVMDKLPLVQDVLAHPFRRITWPGPGATGSTCPAAKRNPSVKCWSTG